MGAHDNPSFTGELLSELHYILLFLLIAAYNSSWGSGPYPAWPRGWSGWTYRILWAVLTNGLVVAVFAYFKAAVHVGRDPADGLFHITVAYFDWTFVLIIVHFVHVKLLEFYTRARHMKFEKLVSTVLFFLTIGAGATISILCFLQHAWLAAVGFTAHTAGLLFIIVAFLTRLDECASKETSATKLLRDTYRSTTGQMSKKK